MIKLSHLCLIISFTLVTHKSFAIAGYLQGQGCPGQVKNNHLVISFEGLGNMGVNQSAISNRYQSLGYTPANYPHIGISSAVQCAKKWKAEYPELKISITGHSCGGSAALETAKLLGRSNINVANVMTIDPACIVRPLYKYSKPNNVEQLINFTGGVGFKVEGGLNCNGGFNHIGMPSNSRVQMLARLMLSGYKVNDCDGNYTAPMTTNPSTEYTLDESSDEEVGNAEASSDNTPVVRYVTPTPTDSQYGNATPEQIAVMKKYGLVHKNPNQPARGCRVQQGCTWLKVTLEALNQPAPGNDH